MTAPKLYNKDGVWRPPTPYEWLNMAQACHITGDEWGMWLALLLWAQGKGDCNTLGVCQGHQPPCVDCPQKA